MDTVLHDGLDWAETVSDLLEHLPDRKRRELIRVVKILSDEFEVALQGKTSARNQGGRILKLILFGSYARGDWVEDVKSGYRSDYDLLVVVNADRFTDLEFWYRAQEHFTRELVLSRQIQTPVSFIVHSIHDVNDQLAHGRPFFVDIARDGITLYQDDDHPLVEPKPLAPEAKKAEAQRNFDQWFDQGKAFLKIGLFCIQEGDLKRAAFILHQATEAFYHCALLTLKLYSPEPHRVCRRPQLVRSRVYDKQNDEQIFS
ncbi:nucleotidyltransferase domain-containing protein [Rhizobium terrae]|uniref:nucleotidyltransferase domain-containing protein n=1 Tax=Rhizobium terrae TaxID=2171756 RepID=UPI000E3E09A2|nr:nucleotidyltransferase domain-containing protein [Rhizobium terrae]